jgi:hypothetical protein
VASKEHHDGLVKQLAKSYSERPSTYHNLPHLVKMTAKWSLNESRLVRKNKTLHYVLTSSFTPTLSQFPFFEDLNLKLNLTSEKTRVSIKKHQK